jgi:hypothetical protein
MFEYVPGSRPLKRARARVPLRRENGEDPNALVFLPEPRVRLGSRNPLRRENGEDPNAKHSLEANALVFLPEPRVRLGSRNPFRRENGEDPNAKHSLEANALVFHPSGMVVLHVRRFAGFDRARDRGVDPIRISGLRGRDLDGVAFGFERFGRGIDGIATHTQRNIAIGFVLRGAIASSSVW